MKMDRQIEPAPSAEEKSTFDRFMGIFSSDAQASSAPARSEDELVLEGIARFILSYDLGVTHVTLNSAHDYVLRKDLHLIRKLREREDAGQPINRIWLEGLAGPKRRTDNVRKLDRVMDHLERNIDSLSSAAHIARDATRDYNHQLADNERKLHDRTDIGVEQIVGLVSQMIGHAKSLELKLQATEEESRAMRDDLKKARVLADQDHLTGLPNRRAFENRMREVTLAHDGSKPVCVGFCDIDHFKQVNDTHGHDTGDRVLRLVAQHLAKATGNHCFVARHGGEEFAVLFDGLRAEQAKARLDEAREKLAARPLKDRRTGKAVGPISFSAGIALYDDAVDAGQTLKAADEALYCAKQQGRNRILISGG